MKNAPLQEESIRSFTHPKCKKNCLKKQFKLAKEMDLMSQKENKW